MSKYFEKKCCARTSILHAKNCFRDELASVGAHHVDTEDLVRLGVCQNLDEAVGVVVGSRSGVGHEGELADFVYDIVLQSGYIKNGVILCEKKVTGSAEVGDEVRSEKQ